MTVNYLTFFINPENTLQAMQGDTVRVSTVKPSASADRGPEGKVEEIISHAFERVVGTFSLGSEAKGDDWGNQTQ